MQTAAKAIPRAPSRRPSRRRCEIRIVTARSSERALQREAVAEDDAERRDAQHVERERHRRRAEDEVHRRQQPVRPLRHLELDEALEREAGDHRRLRRQVRVPLHVELELALPQPERVPLDAGEEDLLVGLEHLCALLGDGEAGESVGGRGKVAAAARCAAAAKTVCVAGSARRRPCVGARGGADAISVRGRSRRPRTARIVVLVRNCWRASPCWIAVPEKLCSSCWSICRVLENLPAQYVEQQPALQPASSRRFNPSRGPRILGFRHCALGA